MKGEWFRFFGIYFDVDRAKKILQRHPRAPVSARIDGAFRWIPPEKARDSVRPDGSYFTYLGVRIDWQHARTIDLATADPLIGVTLAENDYVVIDGWHRMARAKELGIRCLPAFVLTQKESRQVIYRHTYINGKRRLVRAYPAKAQQMAKPAIRGDGKERLIPFYPTKGRRSVAGKRSRRDTPVAEFKPNGNSRGA